MIGGPALPAVAPPSRPLLGLERLWLAADRSWPPFVNQLVVEGEGKVEPARLRAALAELLPAWPAARARLHGSLRSARWVADGPAPGVRELGEGTGVDAALLSPLDPVAGPVVELVCAGERLVLRTHHAAFDGQAAWALARDLGRALRGEAVEGAAFAGVAPPPFSGPAQPPPGADVGPPVPGRFSGAAAPRWARRTVVASGSDRLARVVGALAEASGGRVRVSIPVDLRERLHAGTVAANLTGFVRVDAHPGDALAGVSERIAAAVRSDEPLAALHAADGLRGWPLWLLALLGRASAVGQLRSGRSPTTAAVSNLGRMDAAVFDHPGFAGRALYWLPPTNPGSGCFITLTGHAGGLELVVGLPAGLADGGRLEALADRLAAALRPPPPG